MGKTVIFGGTFNPIHTGHVEMLEALSQKSDVERILVIPANIPPHKIVADMFASASQRLKMCSLATEKIPKVSVSDIELKRGGKSYTFDTLTELQKEYSELAIMIGADMLLSLDTWSRYEDILKLAEVIAVRRPGIDDSAFDAAVEKYSRLGKITVLAVKTEDISSTVLRDALKKRQKNDKIPENVLKYICENNLYSC